MEKLLPADDLDLTGLVRPGDRIICGQGTSEPTALTSRLVAQRHAIGPVDIFLGPTYSDTFAPERTDGIRFTSYGGIGRTASLAKAGRLNVVPCSYSALSKAFASGSERADVVLLQLAPARGGGPYSLSLANDYVALAARHARTVIAEVNPWAPWTYGAELPADIVIHAYVEAQNPPVQLARPRTGEVEVRIATYVADLIPERATLQLGVGAIPEAVVEGLRHHRGLGIHSGLIGDGVVDLIEWGVVTNAHKSIDRGITVSGVLFGTDRLNRHAADNPQLCVCPPEHTHGRDVLSQLNNFIALNSAIEVDLTGQVNAETVDGVYVGAVGGQPDFMRAANTVDGGRAIIALPSTAKGGSISRIVPQVTTVTTPRSDVDVIVTEWGVAELRGCTLRERARRMIAIAAPQCRETLERAAHAQLRGLDD